MSKRILSILFVLALCLSLFPAQAFAASIDSISVSGIRARYAQGSNIQQDLSSVTFTANPAGGDSYEVTSNVAVSPSHTTWQPNTNYTAEFTLTIDDDDSISDSASIDGLPIGLSPNISSSGNSVTVTLSGFSVYRVISSVSLNGLFDPPQADRHEGKTIPEIQANPVEPLYTVSSVTLKKGNQSFEKDDIAAAGNYDLVVTVTPTGTYDVFAAASAVQVTGTLAGGSAYSGTVQKSLSADKRTLTLTFPNIATYTPHSFTYTGNGDGTHDKACTVTGCGHTVNNESCTWGSAWKSDAAGHWHECTLCHGESTHTSHTPNSEYLNDGVQHWHKCTACDYVPLGAANHNYTYVSVDDVNHTKTCADCGYSENEGHHYDAGVETVAPTTTSVGTRTYTCSDCNHQKQEEIPKLTPSGGGGGGDTGLGTNTPYSWGERAVFGPVGISVYRFLNENDEPGTILTKDDTWELAETDPVIPEPYEISDVFVLQDDEEPYYDGQMPEKEQFSAGVKDPLSNIGFFQVDTQNGDRAINFKALTSGHVVRTTTFNGIYITKLTRSDNPHFEHDLQVIKNNIFASYRAFELDHPEVFWLNGSLKLRVLTPTINGKQVSYVFLTTADSSGFSMRIAHYAAPNAIAEGIALRNAREQAIYDILPKGDTRETITAINRWLIMHNEYNRSEDLSTIGLIPHQVLCALIGHEGVHGPVCDSYSKAFKLLCDRCGIPCVLMTGSANNRGRVEHHMWNEVMLDGHWYGVDVAWNDPVVKGIYGAVSGYENEKFLLVGASTMIDGMSFGQSHIADETPAAVEGIFFNGLEIDEYSQYAVPFDDVFINEWFYEAVRDVCFKDLMRGTSESTFEPKAMTTRGQIVQILYNIAGQPAVKEVVVDGWFGKAASWALEKGIAVGFDDGDFHGNDPVTREQLITMLWAFEGAPKVNGTPKFADADQIQEYALTAMTWAQKNGLIAGKPGNLADPQGNATRAEIATVFSNYTN